MKAAVLIRTGDAAKAFEIREVPTPVPGPDEVLIKVAAFGLNFADVMARHGMYKDAPPLPAILGYDVAGTIAQAGASVQHVSVGDKVTAMTRFGGYAEYAVTKSSAVARIPESIDFATATALTTQYCTAYFAAAEMLQLHQGDKVLIHSGAGGVGSALIQYAVHKRCEVFATCGSEEKLENLRQAGVQHPINYRSSDFAKLIQQSTGGKGVDVIFDAVGGSSVKKGIGILAAGGRIVCYGASAMTGKSIFGKIGAALGFGFFHPVMLMMPSKAIIGLNMLRIADEKPAVIQRCLEAVVQLTESGVFTPRAGRVFRIDELAQAHEHLENRNSTGKIAVTW